MRKRRIEKRAPRVRVFRAEVLEERALLSAAAETFNAPDLSAIVAAALRGRSTHGAAIDQMTSSLESQLKSGPLADLQAGKVDGNGFIQEVQSLESSFEQSVDQQLLPHFVNIDTMIKMQGQQVVARLIAVNQQAAVGLVSSASAVSAAQGVIDSLTAGPIHALKTPVSGFVAATTTFEGELNTLVQSLGSSATTPLTVAQVGATLPAEAEAYRAQIHAGAAVTHPGISAAVDNAVTTLETTAAGLAQSSATDAQSGLQAAVAAFDAAVLDTTGLFGTRGPVHREVARRGSLPVNRTDDRLATTITAVSATATTGGTASLTATLDSSSGTGVSGAIVEFTIEGAFAGAAMTDADGVATLKGVPAAKLTASDPTGVYATFAGNAGFKASTGTGPLTVTTSQHATALSSVSGTATFGGTATLTATLTASATGSPLSGKTVSFTLDGTAVGSATTNSNGVATLSDVATTDSGGTHTGVVVASFAGDTNDNAAPNGTGDLTVSPAAAALASVSGNAPFGGPASLTATLTSSATGQGVSGATVSFTLDGTSVGTAVTNSSGVATLTGVATTDAVGSHTGAVVASFAGNANDQAASNGTGDLTVSQAATTLASVSGTASSSASPETATLSATLTSTATGLGVAGETVSFTLDGASAGTAVTDANGVATLTNVATADAAGSYSGVVVASFAGDTNNKAAADATGDLVVS